MQNRPLFKAVRLIALLAFSFSALADESGPTLEQQADWQERLERAAALKADANARLLSADEILAAQHVACFKRFLVYGCQRDARKVHLAAQKEARLIENEGKTLERAVKKEQLSDKDQRRSEAAPQREADLKQREAEATAEREAAVAQEAATRASKAQKAEEGSKRRAADAEKYQQKQADHDARVAAKVKEAERRSAEAAAAPK